MMLVTGRAVASIIAFLPSEVVAEWLNQHEIRAAAPDGD
jgi:hypothetical protein